MEGIYEELKCYSYNFVINVIKPNLTLLDEWIQYLYLFLDRCIFISIGVVVPSSQEHNVMAILSGQVREIFRLVGESSPSITATKNPNWFFQRF